MLSLFLFSLFSSQGTRRFSAPLQSVPVPLLLRKNAFSFALGFSATPLSVSRRIHSRNCLQRSWWWAAVSSLRFGTCCNSSLTRRICPAFLPFQEVVGSSGLEPPTSRLSGVRSNHLSYEPISLVPRRLVSRPVFACFLWLSPPAQPVVEMNRFELLTPCLQGRCSPN